MMSILVIAAICVTAAAVIGGITGFATSMLVTPALLLLGLDLADVVVTNLAATLVTRLVVLWNLRSVVAWRAVGLLAGGSVPGAIAGAATAAFVDRRILTLVAGFAVAAAGVHMLAQRSVDSARTIGPTSFAAVGAVGGYLSTTISLNGPPVAVLLGRTRRSPTEFVADFAGYFVVVNSLSLLILMFSAQIAWSSLWPLVPVLMAAAIVGNRIGMLVHPRVPVRAFQLLVSVLVLIAGLATIGSAA